MTDLVVGRVLEAHDHAGARGPSFLLRLDLGARGQCEAQMEPGAYTHGGLVGTLVVVSIDEQAIVVAARSHSRGPILVRPESEVEPGTVVG